MELFTLKEASFLIKYYKSMLIGKKLDKKSDFEIVALEVKETEENDGKVRVVCVSSKNWNSLFKDLRHLVDDYHLLSIKDVLKDLDQ